MLLVLVVVVFAPEVLRAREEEAPHVPVEDRPVQVVPHVPGEDRLVQAVVLRARVDHPVPGEVPRVPEADHPVQGVDPHAPEDPGQEGRGRAVDVPAVGDPVVRIATHLARIRAM